MRSAVFSIITIAVAFRAFSAGASARELTYWQAVRAIDAQLARGDAREDLEISLGTVHRGSRVAAVLEQLHYIVRTHDGYRFTSAAIAGSRRCDAADARCRVFPFGSSVRAGLPIFATLYSRPTTFNEALWTYWFTYLVTPQTDLAKRAAREPLVDTISAPDTRCPAVWTPKQPLLANASVGPDLPFQIEIKSHLYLHGAIERPKSKTALACDFDAMELEIEQTR